MLMATAMQAQDVIDMHAHIITPSFLADLKAHDALLDEGFHFLRYKQGTMHMVKSLKLSDMRPLDPETMKLLFKKLF